MIKRTNDWAVYASTWTAPVTTFSPSQMKGFIALCWAWISCLPRNIIGRIYRFAGASICTNLTSSTEFYETTINLTNITPDFDFYRESQPIYTRRRDLPASKINACTITECLTADGCIITNGNLMRSVIGIRTIIESGATLDRVVCMGADWYETEEEKNQNRANNIPDSVNMRSLTSTLLRNFRQVYENFFSFLSFLNEFMVKFGEWWFSIG